MTEPQVPRLDYLDAVRAGALLLGVVFHASLSFMPIYIGWAVMDIATSDWVSVFVLVSHSFRMELFFLVAGYFSHLALQKKGAKSFVRSRLIRIGVPLLIGWWLVKPLLNSGWAIGAQSMRGEADVWAVLLSSIVDFEPAWQQWYSGTHLWFLYYLLVITCLMLLLRKLKPANGFIQISLHGIGHRLSHSNLGLAMVALPTAYALWHMQGWGMDTPDQSLRLNVPVLCVYLGFFATGWVFQRQHNAIEAFSRISVGKCVVAVLAISMSIYLSQFALQTGRDDYLWLKAAFVLSYAVMMWTLVALVLGVCRVLLAQQSSIVRYLADASYWIYLVHLPVVVWLQIAVAELSLTWPIKLVVVVFGTLCVTLVTYDILVRSTAIGNLLNGKRRASILFGYGTK